VRGAETSYIFVKVGETSYGDESNDKQTASEKSWVFKKVPVSTGVENNNWVAVNLFEPLPDSSLIAYSGAYELNSEMGAGEREGHGH